MSDRAHRVWHIEVRFDRYYVVNQYGGFAGRHPDRAAAVAQLCGYITNDGDSHDPAQDQWRPEDVPATPICNSPFCEVPLVRRDRPDDLAASLGVWWDHPTTENYSASRGGVGHTSSVVVPHAREAS